MNLNLDKVIQLLKKFETGDNNAKEELLSKHDTNSQILLEEIENHVYEILEEFKLMYSFNPGQSKGLQPLINFAEKIKQDYGIAPYNDASWETLLKLRGPFGMLTLNKCATCLREYPCTAIGDFADMATFNCTKCFKTAFGHISKIEDPNYKCAKDNLLVFNKCPICLTSEILSKRDISGYEYFYDKEFYGYSDKCIE